MKIVALTPSLILPAYAAPVDSIVDYIDSIGAVAHWRMNDAAGATALVDRIAGEQAALSGSYTLAAPGLVAGDSDKAV